MLCLAFFSPSSSFLSQSSSSSFFPNLMRSTRLIELTKPQTVKDKKASISCLGTDGGNPSWSLIHIKGTCPSLPTFIPPLLCQLHPSTPQFTQVTTTWVPEDGCIHHQPQNTWPRSWGCTSQGSHLLCGRENVPSSWLATLSGTRKGPKVWIQPPQDPTFGDLCPAEQTQLLWSKRGTLSQRNQDLKNIQTLSTSQHWGTASFSVSDGIPG